MSQLVNSNISSSLIRENVQPGVIDTYFRRTDFINFLMSRGAFVGWYGASQPMSWNLIYAGNGSAEAFNEGAAIPVPGKQSYAQTSLAPFYLHASIGYSGHVEDQARAGGVWADPIQTEIDKGMADLMKKLEDTLVGSTQDQGIQSVIDGGDTYANLAPGTYTTHASIETAVGGALTFTVLEDNLETGALALAQPTDILSAHNQITNYLRLAGASATTSLLRVAPGTKDFGTGDATMAAGQVSYNGRPWVGISGLTSTVILMLDMSPGVRPEFCMWKAPIVEPLAKTSHDTQLVATVAGAIRCPVRRAHIKLTGVTA